jgi:DnaK suppressor protein
MHMSLTGAPNGSALVLGGLGRAMERNESRGGNMARRGRAMIEPPAFTRPAGAHGRQQTTRLVLLSRERRKLLAQGFPPRDISPDPLDAAKEIEEERLWLAVLDRRDEIQGQIKEAVQLLSEGRYGRCVECGVPIPRARLHALPFAVRCMACQERFEAESGQVAARHSSA